MPLYTYECSECEQIMEEVKSISNRNICPDCPICNKSTKKITTQMNFKLTGPGWAADGYTKLSDKSNLV